MIAPGIQTIVLFAQAVMRSLRPKWARAAFALTVFPCLGGAGTPAFATTYYVSPTGSDSNNGTSTSTPWQTITKVNSAHFVAGDSVLFQGGQTFTGAPKFSYATNIPSSSATNPITVGSYGTGAAEILSNTTGSYSAAITVNGVNGLEITGLTILGGGGTGPTTWIGVYILNQSGSSKSGVTVNNCDISNFAGTSGSQSSEVLVSGYYGALDTINITNNQLHGANGVGSKDSNGIYGIGNGEDITNVTYAGNTVYNLGGLASNTGGGIIANDVNGGLLEYNIAHDIGGNSTSCGGPCGIWAYASNNITIQYNEVYNVRPITYSAGCDWNAYDLDGGVSNSYVQYNYSHNNFGCALLAYVQTVGGHAWGNNVFRYNISENDALGSGNANQAAISITASPTNPIQIYGNTIYMGLKNSSGLSVAMQSNNGVAVALPTGSIIENNIFDMVPQTYYGHTYNEWMYFPYGLSGGTINNNVYYGGGTYQEWRVGSTTYTSLASYQTATGYDLNTLTSNPALANPGGGGTLSWTPSLQNGPQPAPAAYWLSSGSPALTAGATVSAASRDYYANPVPNGGVYSIGAYEGNSGAPVAPSNLVATWATALNGWFTLNWTDNSNNETGFTVQSYNGSTWNTYSSVAANVTTYTRTGLTMPSGPYTMRVVATNAAGNSAPSNQVTFSLPTPPSGPTGLVATPGTAQVALSWDAVTGASNYNIQRATASGGPFSILKYNNNGTTYTDTTVTSGTTYYYEVNWNSSAGGSLWSTPPASATPN
jgi:hypothetical protein